MKKLAAIIVFAVLITILFFYLGVFSPLRTELENSLQHNFLNKVSINEQSIENEFDRFIEATKSLSSRTMIKNKLIEYNNQKSSLEELQEYTQSKYVDGVQSLDNIIAAYRITDNEIVAGYGELDLEAIQSDYNKASNELEIIVTAEKDSVIINSPILNDNGNKLGSDIAVFDLSGFMESLNQNEIQYEIIYSETALKQPLDQEDQIFEYRRILDTNYWLKAAESKTMLYESLNTITTRIIIIFVIMLLGFFVVFYRTISNAFKNIIYELENKIKKLDETKKLLENLTNQVPGTLYQFQSKKGGGYFFPYVSKGLYDVYELNPEEVKDNASKFYNRLHEADYQDFTKSVEDSKKTLTTWNNIYRVNLPEKGIRWIEGSSEPEKLSNGEVLWHGYIRDITERKKAKDELEIQYQFQKSLANVSSILVNLSSDNFDQKINKALAELGDFFDLERIQIFKLAEDKKYFSSIQEWNKRNIASSKKELQNLSIDKLPWWIDQVKKQDYFTICSIEELPEKAEEDKKFLNSIGVKSAASVSIQIDNELFGWYAFVNIKEAGICESEKFKYINIFTEVITRAIAKNLDERKIERLTYYDSLTALYNRRFFEEEIKRLDTKRQLPISIIVADLNGLKIINDSYGHDKGDEILKKAAQILKSSLRQEDILARQGGDEFAILLPNTTAEAAEQIEQRIKQKCKNTKKDMIPVSIALGRSTKENSEQNIEKILKKADDKMYKNKLSESRSSKSNIVQGLINVLNSKSNETKEHSVRMTKIAFEFGESLGLSNFEQNRLSILATLHDIGKININEEILMKKESLDDEEWENIKKHSEYGYKIAKSSEEFAAVAEDILTHHEWWNGTGYPRGLKGEDIPYLARIISIIDAYDVMTHESPYSSAISKKEALREIRDCAGSQFDPKLAEVFIEMMGEN